MTVPAMWTLDFWKAAGERAAKTVAQTMLALWLVGDVAFNVFDVDWLEALGVGLGAAVLSLLMSVASSTVSPVGTPSLVGEPPQRHP